ncbi:PREDICTED: spermatogenesis-associated protein 22 isoform X1 [Dipodomys ordii]|uniref:Spermatogenesis-associated protein 22 isoform X1 n=1 Tax=Dipodomys ordii TaxID=10020 RepID=A0A1S3EXP3_DIPOR|nr:PREDICTED: spermatogenesis-associated protein 22 isoform X1 [Dipodomys ordii]
MKRNLNENSTRSTAGCLQVPLFNQKKRNRQPLTSNPLKNDPGIGIASESYDCPPVPTDWAWEAVTPELAHLKDTMNPGPTSPSVSCPLRSEDSMSKYVQSYTERNTSDWSYRDDDKNTSLHTWDANYFRPQFKKNVMAKDTFSSCPVSLGTQPQKQLRISEPSNLSGHKETEILRQTSFSKMSGTTKKGLDKNSRLQAFKPNFQQNQFKKKTLDDISEENTLKKTPLHQLQYEAKNSSLRIISAVIESMKYWRKHTQKSVLLFELLAVLDSAVTSGPYYSKTFLMRDGKNTLPCVFYEIDCELPRLIRGRVHRCVGNYEPEKNIFKCVSVRPASVCEQKTFQAFVKIVDAEMKYYTKAMNEI